MFFFKNIIFKIGEIVNLKNRMDDFIIENLEEKLEMIFDNKKIKYVSNVNLSEEEIDIILKQNKFHFVPSSLIKKHYDENLYKLQLHNIKIKKTNQNEFLNYIKKSDWIHNYFIYIEKIIKKSQYEEEIEKITKKFNVAGIFDGLNIEQIKAIIFLENELGNLQKNKNQCFFTKCKK